MTDIAHHDGLALSPDVVDEMGGHEAPVLGAIEDVSIGTVAAPRLNP